MNTNTQVHVSIAQAQTNEEDFTMTLPKTFNRKYLHMVKDYYFDTSERVHDIELKEEYDNGNDGHIIRESNLVNLHDALSEVVLRDEATPHFELVRIDEDYSYRFDGTYYVLFDSDGDVLEMFFSVEALKVWVDARRPSKVNDLYKQLSDARDALEGAKDEGDTHAQLLLRLVVVEIEIELDKALDDERMNDDAMQTILVEVRELGYEALDIHEDFMRVKNYKHEIEIDSYYNIDITPIDATQAPYRVEDLKDTLALVELYERYWNEVA